jgi:cytochrome bd ubiquinol oxidase subunit II
MVLWLCIKASGNLSQRSHPIVTPLWLLLAALTLISLIATIAARPASLDNYHRCPFTFIVPVGVMACDWHLASQAQQPNRQSVSMLLPLTLAGPHTLAVGLAWWLLGMALAASYAVFVNARFRGKVDLSSVAH